MPRMPWIENDDGVVLPAILRRQRYMVLPVYVRAPGKPRYFVGEARRDAKPENVALRYVPESRLLHCRIIRKTKRSAAWLVVALPYDLPPLALQSARESHAAWLAKVSGSKPNAGPTMARSITDADITQSTD